LTLAHHQHATHGAASERPWLRRTVEPQSAPQRAISVGEFAAFIEDPCPPGADTTREALYQQFIGYATDWIIRWCDRELIQRDIVTAFDAYGVGRAGLAGLAPVLRRTPAWLDLPRVATDAITSVEVYDSDGNSESIAAADYSVDLVSEPHRIEFDSAPTQGSLADFRGIRVTYMAGYADQASIPAALKLGVSQLAAYLYERRGAGANGAMVASGAAQTVAGYRVLTGL